MPKIHILCQTSADALPKPHASVDTHMRWLRSVGSIKLWVSFAEYRLFYRALLQKRPMIWSILLTKATLLVRSKNPDQTIYGRNQTNCGRDQPKREPLSNWNGLFRRELGLFRRELGLFRRELGLFRRESLFHVERDLEGPTPPCKRPRRANFTSKET